LRRSEFDGDQLRAQQVAIGTAVADRMAMLGMQRKKKNCGNIRKQ
jgi:hypothetical protein